jgi:hypothetical protein
VVFVRRIGTAQTLSLSEREEIYGSAARNGAAVGIAQTISQLLDASHGEWNERSASSVNS